MNNFLTTFLLWGGWLILPMFVETIKNIYIYFFLHFKKKNKKEINIKGKPLVTILIPVYNSSKTLKMCLESLVNQTYGLTNIEVFLLNNGKVDESYEIFMDFQRKHHDIRIWWMNTNKGKSNALNKGIFNSNGKYIINIDSDGWLDNNAISNIVKRFESDSDISSMTGVVLIDPNQIVTKNILLKLLQKSEFVEYVESFLIGRNIQSKNNELYTMAGAFSCFKRDAIMKTQLYNPQTLGEDTHMTFQIRKFIGGKIVLCENAILYVDPIESLDKLYMQRQRWQRSTFEVATMFKSFHFGSFFDFFKKPHMRLIIKDHSVSLTNLFWTFSLIYFFFVEYPLLYFILSHLILWSIYSFNSILYNFLARKFLKEFELPGKYLKRNIWVSFFMIPYRTITYLIRISAFINSITSDANWNHKTLREEISIKFHSKQKK